MHTTTIKHYASGAKYQVNGKPAPKAAYVAAQAQNLLTVVHAVAKVKAQLASQPSVEQERAKAAQAQELLRPAAKYVAPRAGVFTLGERAQAIVDRQTLQRRALGAGINWHKVGQLATNTRLLVLEKMGECLEDTFTRDEFITLFKQHRGLLGSGTPGSYWREFCRLEYIVQGEE